MSVSVECGGIRSRDILFFCFRSVGLGRGKEAMIWDAPPVAARLPLPFPLVLCSEILSPLKRSIFGGLSSSSSLSALSTASSGKATALLIVIDRRPRWPRWAAQNLECRRAKPAAKLPLGAAWDVDAWRAKARVALAARAACEGAARHARSPVGCATLFMVVKFVVKLVVVCLKTVCATLRRSWLSIPRRGDRT